MVSAGSRPTGDSIEPGCDRAFTPSWQPSSFVLSRCKKGDVVVRFTPESAFAGAAVVFEAKRDASYTTQKAIDELDIARKNREASVGVFVMARSHALESFPRFARFGRNVLITWDDQDDRSDGYLHAAILLGLGLVTRKQVQGDAGDVAALHDVQHRIENEISRLEKMEKHNDTIRRNSDGIAEEIRRANKGLDLLLRRAKSTLCALNVELHEEDVERESPIDPGNDSLQRATQSLLPGSPTVARGNVPGNIGHLDSLPAEG